MRFSIAYFIFSAHFFISLSLDAYPSDTTCVLFSQKDYRAARELFIKSQAKSRLASDMKAAAELHDRIISGFDDEIAESICQSSGAKKEDIINSKIGTMQLTAMHIAAMMGDVEALKWLFDNSADINARDVHAFTPAHFAALQATREALNYLADLGAQMHAHNSYDGTPEQVWKMTHLVNPKTQEIKVFNDWNSEVEPEDGNTFCVITRTTFIEGIKQMPVDVISNWNRNDRMQEPEALKALTSGLKNAQLASKGLYIKRLTPLKFGVLWETKDFGLFAGRDFSRGEVVELYAGLWQNGPKEMTQGPSGFDTNQFRGYLPFARQGFPNVEIFPFANKLGFRDGSFAIAIRPIQKNDPIVWHAPGASTQLDVVTEANPDELDAFLSQNPLSKILAMFKNDSSLHLYEIRNRAIVLYLARNPLVFIRLLAEQKIGFEDMRRIHDLGLLSLAFVDTKGRYHQASNHIFFGTLENQFASPMVREFFSMKARQGHIVALLLMVQSMGNTHFPSPVALEMFWQQMRANYCSILENKKASPKACAGL